MNNIDTPIFFKPEFTVNSLGEIQIETPFGIMGLSGSEVYNKLRLDYAKADVEAILTDKGFFRKEVSDLIDADFMAAYIAAVNNNETIHECYELIAMECVDMKLKGEIPKGRGGKKKKPLNRPVAMDVSLPSLRTYTSGKLKADQLSELLDKFTCIVTYDAIITDKFMRMICKSDLVQILREKKRKLFIESATYWGLCNQAAKHPEKLRTVWNVVNFLLNECLLDVIRKESKDPSLSAADRIQTFVEDNATMPMCIITQDQKLIDALHTDATPNAVCMKVRASGGLYPSTASYSRLGIASDDEETATEGGNDA